MVPAEKMEGLGKQLVVLLNCEFSVVSLKKTDRFGCVRISEQTPKNSMGLSYLLLIQAMPLHCLFFSFSPVFLGNNHLPDLPNSYRIWIVFFDFLHFLS